MDKWLLLAPAAAWLASFGFASIAIAQPTIEQKSDSVTAPSKETLQIAEVPNPSSDSSTPQSGTSIKLDLNSTPAASGMQRLIPLSQLASSEAKPATPGMSQVTSVSQLSDVRPTDWAFQALQSLVERYGCIAGYPDRTYRGNRAMTRYEFAAGLNACLDRVNELIAAATADLVKKEDLTTLQKLQEEFAAELATLRGRVDGLETRVTTLEKQQFSTTTKLTGNIFFNLTGAFPTGDVLTERNPAVAGGGSAFAPPVRGVGNVPSRVLRSQPNITFGYYAFLNLTTSFTGRDQLVTQLVAGNGNSPANELVSSGFFNSWGTPFLDQTGLPPNSGLAVRELFYSFPLNDSVRVSVGPRLNFYRYFDQNRFTFFLTGAGSFNSNGSTLSNAVDRGSGVVIAWNISRQLRLTTAYLAENTEFLNSAGGFNTSSNPTRGLFNSTNTISAELAYSPSPNFNFRFLYTRSSLFPTNGFIGGSAGEPLPYGYADDGFGGRLRDSGADAFIANFDWLITPKFGIFGRYSYARTDINPVNPARTGGDVRVQSFQAGLGFPDLGKKGALGVISFVMPYDYLDGQEFLLSGGGDGGTQYDLEVSYYYPLNRNIAIIPSFYAIFNANNFESNPTVFVGNVRTQFSF
jgi:hypothetical protein